ncbi:RNA polymerase subunit sigma-70 [Streptomyces sp. TRM43335]|uniref:RNA polymerase subunit sigma-70 n=1 Tax=Streptomyces taklimakanensis TaxID=2569853 RepID=A0A6G2BEH4_9ACTN|nr:RNA polymerase subunit sigma-70 [Streptomyces taklimakanensis]MTE20658.1 RNA polymerase subunit sigma-70 [Streptomyces taklimakanensis]
MTETVSVRAPGNGTRSGTGSGLGTDSGKCRPAGRPAPPEERRGPAGSGPAEAFDRLHRRHAAPLFRQVYLLTGDRRSAGRAVGRAFRLAWERWPEVAVDPDPAGWVRAAAHEYALAPWQRFLPRPRPRRATTPAPANGGDGNGGGSGGTRAPKLPLEALLRLPPVYRRTLLLHDGLGIDLPETAAECEASTAAAAGRLMHAREGLAEYVPELSRVAPDRRRRMIRDLLEEAAAAGPEPETASARAVRGASEGRVRLRTGAAVGMTALLTTAVGLTAVAGPRGQVPERPPAVSVHAPDRDGPADGR